MMIGHSDAILDSSLMVKPTGIGATTSSKKRQRAGTQKDIIETQLETATIDDDGDVLIQVGRKEIRVASKLLCFASPVFDAMLKSRFIEGETVRSARDPLGLPLPEDNPEAMERLLHVFHFNKARTYSSVDPSILLAFAQLVDKYDCCVAARGECGRWFKDTFSEELEGRESDTTLRYYRKPLAAMSVEDLWTLAAATSILHLDDEFERVTCSLAKESRSTDDSPSATIVALLPTTFERNLQSIRGEMIGDLLGHVERAIDALHDSDEEFEWGDKCCTSCGRFMLCGDCDYCVDDPPEIACCNKGFRIDAFHDVIRDNGIWPFTRSAKDAPGRLLRSIYNLRHAVDHECEGKMECPLVLEVFKFKDAVIATSASWRGIRLSDIKNPCARHAFTKPPCR